MTEEKEVKRRFRERSDEAGLCTAFKVFNLGSHGTCYVGCGLPPGHESNIDGMPGVTYPQHQTVQTNDDGAQVIFRWPV